MSRIAFAGNTSVPQMTAVELSFHFFLRLAIILVVCRYVSWAVAKLGQSPVFGEMIAEMVLGLSIFGYFLQPLQGEPIFNTFYRQTDGSLFKNAAA